MDNVAKEFERLGSDHHYDYYLLVRHENFSSLADEMQEVYVTFHHQSIQEFCGAYYFIKKSKRTPDITASTRKLSRDYHKIPVVGIPLYEGASILSSVLLLEKHRSEI